MAIISWLLVSSSQILARVWLRAWIIHYLQVIYNSSMLWETTNCTFRYVTSIRNVSERDRHKNLCNCGQLPLDRHFITHVLGGRVYPPAGWLARLPTMGYLCAHNLQSLRHWGWGSLRSQSAYSKDINTYNRRNLNAYFQAAHVNVGLAPNCLECLLSTAGSQTSMCTA